MDISVNISASDNSDEILEALKAAALRALERCGATAESHAVKNIKKNKSIDTSNLINSITHKVDPSEEAVYIGTNVSYAPYVELGTGKYAEGGGGRPGWWVYVKDGAGGGSGAPQKTYTYQEAVAAMMALRRKGLDAHMTQGQKPKPFLKPAVEDHTRTYRNIIRDEMENA